MTIYFDESQTSWDGTNAWGVDEVTTEIQEERDILGVAATKRVACFEIYSVDPSTLAFGTKLSLRERGGLRTINGRNRMQQDDLEFALNDTTGRYLPGGDLYNLIEVNSLVGVKWTVSNSFGSRVYYGNIYRIVDPPDRGRSAQGQLAFSVTAQDWLRVKLEQSANYVPGVTPLRQAIELKTDMLAQGCPIVGSSNSWATVAGAILFYLAGERLRVTGNWSSSSHPTDDDLQFMVDPIAVEALARAPSWWDVFNFCAWLGRVQGTYDGDGWPRIKESNGNIDSGLYVGCESNVGRLTIPWENPVRREIARPQFTAFSYYVTYVEETASGPVVHLDFLAQKHSNASNNPHIEPAGRGEVEIARGNFVHSAVNQSAMGYVSDVLQRVLSEADTVTIPVDSAFPASEYIMQNIRIALEDEGITGEFRLNQIQQPLDERPSTLILNWVID